MSLFPILVGAVLSSMLGAAWYSPALFGPAWMKALGKTEDELTPAGKEIAGSALSCLIAASAMEWLVVSTGSTTALAGASVGALVGLGIVAMTMLSDALFSGWGVALYAIQVGYRATYLLLMGTISGAWPR